ncbi:PseG/SpsG family protein [Pseudodesulfovibrio sediminis]|uniref:Glycosyl transferase family 28 C-terminal domain-containing protein n=1 Tax=Pseudodesulfovibrio sediminis TaxID=2810563 RepID=A0ABN6EUL1_9BACT|nr:glycosyltransferase [Pseudodesulfovibrio sediminis]BCS89197.1 hypothetical protein PSDVSF_24390 [Pseudodesulfovibrio sediminis]
MKKLAIRVDGNRHIGLGHVFRCLHLAEYLQGCGWESTFLVLQSSLESGIHRFFEDQSFDFVPVSRPDDIWEQDHEVLRRALGQGDFDAVVLDLIQPDKEDDDLNSNTEFCPMDVQACLALIRSMGIRSLAISDRFEPVDLVADVVVNTCPAQRAEWYEGSESRFCVGPRYYFLPTSFQGLRHTAKVFREDRPHIVVFCGGNDHRGFTPVVLDALATLSEAMTVEVILGAATQNGEEKCLCYEKQGIACQYGVEDMAPVLFNADFVISASGNTLFDLAALGIPAAAVSTRPRQLVTAEYFTDQGCCLNLGMEHDEIATNIRLLLPDVISSRARLEAMSCAGKKAVDGNGMERVASVLDSFVSL